MKKTILFALMALLCPFIILSQGINWKTNGNSGINSNNFIGTINKADLIFKTHDTTRMVIGQNGTIEAFDDVRVHGTLFVGDSTIALTDNSLSQTPPLLTAEITSGNGRMALGRSSFTGLPFIASNFSLGVGGSHHQHKVHIESQSNNVAFEARIGFTNNTTGHNASTLGSTVGLINGSRNFLINQQENASIFFNTSGLPRMNIAGNGYVGIGDYTTFSPIRKLDIIDDLNVPQLRLSYNQTGSFTDFYNTLDGFLLINPAKGRVGINLTDINLPTEALDINGDVRIRQMPLNNTLTEVVVIDATGKLFRNTAIGSGGGGGDADWYEPGNTAPNHIDDDIFTFNNVSIGASTSFSTRLYSYNGIDNAHHQTNMKHSIYSNTLVDPTYTGGSIYGIYSYMVNSNPLLNVKKFAVLGHTACNSNETFNVAIKGDISGGSKNIGIWGTVPTGDLGNWAGYFDGNVQINGNLVVTGTYPTSDIIFKENIEDLSGALAIINQLNPKTFNFKTEEYQRMHFSEGQQFGMIAQDVEPILPSLIKDCYAVPVFDSAGIEIEPELEYKSLNYNAFIPILIQGIKEQQDSIDALKEIISSYESRFEQIETMLAACCESGAKNAEVDVESDITISIDPSVNEEQTKLYQNIPNPFREKTTFNYKIGKAGFVELEITDEFGRMVTTLVETNQETGNYSVNWDTNDLAPGIYFYTLKVDGMVWVKKAIKIK